MKSRIAVLAVSAAALAGLFAAPSANAAGSLCYDVSANIAGTPVAQAGCVPIG